MTEQILGAEAAQTVALRAVAFLASDEERWKMLLAQTGLDADSLRGSLDQPSFLAQIVAFLMQHENWAADFCAEVGGDEGLLWRVQHGLEGGAGEKR